MNMFWEFLLLYQILFSPQVKESMIGKLVNEGLKT